MDGFLGIVTARLGSRGVTIYARDNPEQPKQLTTRAAHTRAMRKFFPESRGGSGHTSVWVPERINAMWMTCSTCSKTSDYEKSAGRKARAWDLLSTAHTTENGDAHSFNPGLR